MRKKVLPLALCGSAAMTCLFANPAFALQISDGQFAGEYNGIDLAAAQAAYNGIQAQDGMMVGAIIA